MRVSGLFFFIVLALGCHEPTPTPAPAEPEEPVLSQKNFN